MNKDITPKLLFIIALGGYKVKGAAFKGKNIEQELTEFMERNNCTIVLDRKKNLIFKPKK